MAFPDPSVPIATCEAPDCAECPVAGSVHCHLRPAELALFPANIDAGFSCRRSRGAGRGPDSVTHLGCSDRRVLRLRRDQGQCSHCPHYAEEGATLRCWADHVSPKLCNYRPGPMSTAEKAVFFGGLVAVWGYPLAFFVFGGLWLLLGPYSA